MDGVCDRVVMEASFEAVSLHDLETMADVALDVLPFGVIGFGPDTAVRRYSAAEARMAGLDPATVMGVPLFDVVAQCMNNFLVAQRFDDEPELDAIVPYVLTLRMRPTRVRLRLLASADAPHRYILVER